MPLGFYTYGFEICARGLQDESKTSMLGATYEIFLLAFLECWQEGRKADMVAFS